MNIIQCIIITSLFSVSAMAQSYTINCTAQKTTEISRAILTFNKISDTTTFKDGKVTFKGIVKEPGEAVIEIDYPGNGQRDRNHGLYLSPGIINFAIGDPEVKENQEISGNQYAIDYEYKLRQPVIALNEQVGEDLRTYYAAVKNAQADTLELKTKANETIYKCFQVPQVYIKANPNSPVCLVALTMLGRGAPAAKLTVADIQKLYNSLSAKVRQSPEGLKYAKFLEIHGK